MDTYAPPAAPVRRPRVSLWVLRIVTSVFVVAVLTQPVLAGMYLTGDVDAMGVHGLVGELLALGAIVVIGVTLAYVLAGRGSLWVLPLSVVLFLAVGFQIGMGHSRQLELHVPLGVLIATMSLLLTFWAWSPSAARPRAVRSRGAR